MAKSKRFKSPQELWESLSSKSVNFVEEIFFKLGVFVATHPWKTVILTLCFVSLSCVGVLKFHIEKNPMNLWVPPDSDFFYDTNWFIDNFGIGRRFQKVIVTANEILDPKVLVAIYNLSERVNSIKVNYQNKTYSMSDLCYKVPIIDIFGSSRNKRSLDIKQMDANNTISNILGDYSDTTLFFDDEIYCKFLEKLEYACFQYNILDLWKMNVTEISNLTKHEIIKKINNVKANPITGHPFDYTQTLGGKKYDEHGQLVSAKSVMLTWHTWVNMSAINLDEVGNLVGTEDWVSIPLSLWEGRFLEIMGAVSFNLTGTEIFYEAGRSFADISGTVMVKDLDKLLVGILLMFFYIQFALSRFNWLEIKLTLGSVGLLCVGLAYACTIGWCSIFGVSFGPVHSSLPFLLMGLGIDDMFVMSACWENLPESASQKSLPLRIGLMLKHAGVSIVITSFTDIVALLIGAITILPSLKSFCIYAAVGVFFIFCFSVTFYVAAFTLDIKRMQNNRNGVLFCYKHKRDIKIVTNKTIFEHWLALFYKHIVFTIPGKIVVILFTVIVTSFSIEAVYHLEQRFDPKWFIPDDTYYHKFLTAHDYFYPEEGNMGMVFLGEMDYVHEFTSLHNMMEKLKTSGYANDFLDWTDSFHKYVLINYGRDLLINASAVKDSDFNNYLSRFLNSRQGGKFQGNLKFEKQFSCGKPASKIKASTMSFIFKKFSGPKEYLPAMNSVKDLVKSTNITSGDGYRSVWSKVFATWVTDEIIAVEVERNIELALVCVMVCTIILITNLQMCLWMFLCVLLTLINVLGCMQKWGMTVDIVCCIGLELAIGLCVDYAAHVGHTFLTIKEGSKSERAFKTVTSIGLAVLKGGGSTLLSLSLLSASKAYTFQSFFKIFLLVIFFGLFNGLVFLPVCLSLIGPSAYSSKEPQNTTEMVALNEKHDAEEKHLNDG